MQFTYRKTLSHKAVKGYVKFECTLQDILKVQATNTKNSLYFVHYKEVSKIFITSTISQVHYITLHYITLLCFNK